MKIPAGWRCCMGGGEQRRIAAYEQEGGSVTLVTGDAAARRSSTRATGLGTNDARRSKKSYPTPPKRGPNQIPDQTQTHRNKQSYCR